MSSFEYPTMSMNKTCPISNLTSDAGSDAMSKASFQVFSSLARPLLRRERDGYLFEPWISAQGVPVRTLFQFTISNAGRQFGYCFQLLQRHLFFAANGINHAQISDECRSGP